MKFSETLGVADRRIEAHTLRMSGLISGDAGREVELAAGTVGWLPAHEHHGENIGETATHVIFVGRACTDARRVDRMHHHRRRPHIRILRGTLFELPGPADLARERLANHPIGERLAVIAGDLFEQPLPEQHHVVLIANVMYLFSPERNHKLHRRPREGVTAGTRLLLADFWTNPEHTDPPFAALMTGEFLVITGEGDVYSAQENLGCFYVLSSS